MQQLARLFVATLAVGLASSALGAIKVEFRSTTGCSTCFTDITSSVSVDGSRNVTINGPNAGTYRIYSTSASSESLGVITFTGSAATFNLFLSPNATAFDESQQFASSACNGWAGLNPGACHITLQARFTGNLSGTITADRIVRLDTSGSINAKVDQDPQSGSPLLAAIVAGGSITAQINAMKGSIGTVWCFSNLSGSVNAYAQDATINLVEVGTLTQSASLTGAINSFAGSIGSVVVHGDINNGTTAANIRALKGIGLVESDTITSSFISANWDGTSGTHDGRIGRIETLTGNCNAIIQASTISDSSPDNGIFIAGNCTKEIGFNSANNPSNPLPINKPIVIGGNLENGGLVTMDGDFTSVLRIDGALNGDIRIRKSRFLTGQIIINGAAATNGAWGSSRVRFMDRVNAQQQNVSFDISTNSSAPYQAPYYTHPSTHADSALSIGGGAIGLAPFHLHDNDCAPVNTGSQSTAETMLVTEFMRPNPNPNDITSKSIKLRFYGPVRTSAGVSAEVQPLRVLLVPTIGDPLDVSQSVDITMKRGDDAGWSREVEIKGKSGAGLLHGTYCITPRIDHDPPIFCDQLFMSNPPLVSDFTYWIELREDCNTNGVDDQTDLANHPWWDDFPEDGRMDLCEWLGCPSDVNHDGFVNALDYDAFADWFENSDNNADYNYDGYVNALDYDAFALHYEVGC